MPLISNPFNKAAPINESLIETSESFGTRLRDRLLSPLFYHTKTSFVVIALIFAIGLALCIAPWFLPVALGLAIGLTVLGGFVTLLTGLALYIDAHIFGWDKSGAVKEYEEVNDEPLYNEENELMGNVTLNYREADAANPHQSMPYLTINAENHYKCGYIQGYKLAAQGDHMLSKLKRIYSFIRVLNIFGYNVPSWGDDAFIQPFYSPLPEYLKEELQGVLNGHNHWAKSKGKAPITLGDLMMLHMMPDIHNIKDMAVGGELLSTGCTAGLSRDANGNIIHFRNTDWASFNLAGQVSLFVERHIGDEEHTRTASFPLCIGTTYGENDRGLTLSINVSPGATVFNPNGKLAFLLYREFLKNYGSVPEILDRVTRDPHSQPLGPCQLTLSDDNNGAIVRFYQSCSTMDEAFPRDDDVLFLQSKANDHHYFTHDIQRLDAENDLLVVANEGLILNPQGEYIQSNYHDSSQRIQNVHNVLTREACLRDEKDALTALRAPLVNNVESVHTIIKSGSQTYFSASNGYSARFFPTPMGALRRPAAIIEEVVRHTPAIKLAA